MRILIVGDSISAEPYESVPGVTSWVTHFRRLTREAGSRIPNIDRSQDTIVALTRGGRSYLNWLPFVQSHLAIGLRYDVGFCALGVNCITGGPPIASLADFQARAIPMWNALRAGCTDLVVTTITGIGYAGFAPEEILRQQCNAYLRTGANIPRLCDWDLATRHPTIPELWAPGYLGSSDVLHPGTRGTQRLADVSAAAIWQVPLLWGLEPGIGMLPNEP